VQGLPAYRSRKIEIESSADGAAVMATETEVKQVLLNLVINALEATDPKRGVVRIRTTRTGDRLVLEVSDNGKGMTQDTLDHIFEPFFTDKRGVTESNEQHGTGLGLSITHAIVQQHGGRIHAHSAGPGKGSRFTVELPAA
jgi:signal transduction histidine kinase